jgi:hypothetical protein
LLFKAITRPYLKNSQSKKDWRHGFKEQGPEFKQHVGEMQKKSPFGRGQHLAEIIMTLLSKANEIAYNF